MASDSHLTDTQQSARTGNIAECNTITHQTFRHL
jgi:hypothetical protein